MGRQNRKRICRIPTGVLSKEELQQQAVGQINQKQCSGRGDKGQTKTQKFPQGRSRIDGLEDAEPDRAKRQKGKGGTDQVAPEDRAYSVAFPGDQVNGEAELQRVLNEPYRRVRSGPLPHPAQSEKGLGQGIQQEYDRDNLKDIGVGRGIEKHDGQTSRRIPYQESQHDAQCR